MRHDNLSAIIRSLQREYAAHPAPIKELAAERTNTPFRTLIATLLSSRTLDQTTTAACRRLFRIVQTPADLQRMPQEQIERLIYPVGFYRTKARHLKKLPEALAQQFGGMIPDSIEQLVRLPGVGRKTAALVVAASFGKPAICVDTHVHRISNRLGLVQTRSPAATEQALQDILPRRYWKLWNPLLVAFGQRICRPIKPRCATCPIRAFCALGRTSERGAASVERF